MYRFFFLAPSAYTLTVTHEGFRKESQTAPLIQEAIEKALSQEDYELLKATLALKQSREIGDALMQERANAKLMSHLGWAGVDPKVFSYPGWSNVHVPQLATRPMDGARIVLWYAGRSGKFVPAIFCPDVRTAIFVRAFFSLRACPHCGVIFLPEKENVSYCCPAHGHAHRMARSRYLKPNAKSRKEPKSTGTTNRSEAQARELMATKRRK